MYQDDVLCIYELQGDVLTNLCFKKLTTKVQKRFYKMMFKTNFYAMTSHINFEIEFIKAKKIPYQIFFF